MSTILLVDDHAVLRDGLRAVLQAAGHVVVGEAANPGDALALLRLAPDLMLLDLQLGQRSGMELLSEMGKRAVATRCIVLTMSSQPQHVAEALRLGAQGYLLKGSTASELLQAVAAVAAGRRYLTPEVADLAVQALSSRAPADAVSQLSPRERQIITMVVTGQSSATIARTLHLSPKTVDTYRSRLMSKLEVEDIPALVRLAIRAGLISADDR